VRDNTVIEVLDGDKISQAKSNKNTNQHQNKIKIKKQQ